MTRDRRFELMYFAIGWQLWTEVGPYRDNPRVIRPLRIQAIKLVRMLDNADMGISYDEMLGHPPSLNVRKRRGKLHVRAERQHKRVLQCVNEALRIVGEEKFGRALTNKEVRDNEAAFQESVKKVIGVMKQKSPSRNM